MTKKQLLKAFKALGKILERTPRERATLTRRFTMQNLFAVRATVLKHCAWMLPRMRVFVREGRLDKVQRWLGFMQGALWAVGVGSIEDFKQMNMSTEPKKTKPLTEEQSRLLFIRARAWASQGPRSRWSTKASTKLWDLVKNLEEMTSETRLHEEQAAEGADQTTTG